MRPTLSVLIVAWNSRDELRVTLPALAAELGEEDEVIVVDNASQDGTVDAIAQLAPRARLISNDRNLGFSVACNQAAAVAKGDLLIILNPDAAPLAGFGEAIRKPWIEERGWVAWQALVAHSCGTRINSAGNPVHFTGVVWAGRHGQDVRDVGGPHEVSSLSGACMAIPYETWRWAGGFAEGFFLYHEDVDLSLRLRLAGGRLGIEPEAKVDHNYEFGAHEQKWRWLERNRWAFLIRVYPTRLLLVLLPGLFATDLALLVIAFRGGWGRPKVGAIIDVLRWLPGLLRERRQVQATRTVSPAEFATWLTPDLDSPFFHGVVMSAPIRWGLRAYWRVALLLLGKRSTP